MTFAASSRSHEKLDVPESRVAIDEIDALEFDPQLAVNDSQCVGRPGGVKLLVVVPGFDVVHRSPGHEFVVGFISLVDLWRLQDVMAPALGLLRIRPLTLEPLDPDGEQQLVLVHQRGRQLWIGLAPLQRHPIDAVIGEQIEPFVQPMLVDQPRLVDDKIDKLLISRCLHGSPLHIDNVMNFDHARNWLRICHSVVPFDTAVASCRSDGSSWPTTDVGALISRLYIKVRSSSMSGASTRRNVQDSTSVLSAASGLNNRRS